MIPKINDGVNTGPMSGCQSKKKCQTSGDFTHLGDGRLIRGDATELLSVWCGCSWQPQYQRKQPLVPAKGLLGQLTACQWRVQRQVQLRSRQSKERKGWWVYKGMKTATGQHLHSFTNPLPFISLHSLNRLHYYTVQSTTAAFVCDLTSSGTPELCVSLFPSVIVMITDGSRKKGLRPWDGNSNNQQLNPSSSRQWPNLFSLVCFIFCTLFCVSQKDSPKT